jgi:hypothetical protein
MSSPIKLSDHIHFEIDFTTFLYDVFEKKSKEDLSFESTINIAIFELEETLSIDEFKTFQKLLAEIVIRTYPNESYPNYAVPPDEDSPLKAEHKYFLMLISSDEIAPLSYVQQLFSMLIQTFITTNLTDAVVEFYHFTNTLPLIGQVLGIYEYERLLQKNYFKDYKQLHNILPGAMYYLKESIYEERSYCSDLDTKEYCKLILRFCRYDTGDIY